MDNPIDHDRVAGGEVWLSVGGMHCASCVRRVERALERVDGVGRASVSLADGRARVFLRAATEPDALVQAVGRQGFTAQFAASPAEAAARAEEQARSKAKGEVLALVVSAALALPLLAPMLWMPFGVHWELPGWVQMALAAPVQFWVGARFYKGAWHALRAGAGNMDTLVAVGTSAAYGLSAYAVWREFTERAQQPLYFEASAVVIALVLLGKHFEGQAKRGTTAAIAALSKLRPETAHLIRDGEQVDVPVEQLERGNVIAVRPGERIAADGVVLDGWSQVDESLITGESLPVAKEVGSAVTGGAVNGEGLLRVRVEAVGTESTLAQIVTLVQSAYASKAPVQRLVDRVAGVFVPVVLGIAVVTLIGWLTLGDAGMDHALLAAVSVLVIACPCALGLATPTAIMVGTGAAARAGILLKDAVALERAHAITTVVFDKTGTLTMGHPEVVQTQPAHGVDGARLLSLAASVQQGSEHPLAKAIVRSALQKGVQLHAVTQLTAHPGRGVIGRCQGRTLCLGSAQFVHDHGIDTGLCAESAAVQTEQGRSLVWVAETEPQAALLGWVSLGDPVRPSAKAAVERLQRLGIRTVLLSGDNHRAAQTVGDALGIDQVIAEVLPAGKAEEVTRLRQAGRVVAMVGDGINDAPALAAADVGIAMGSGTDVAMQTAGVTLMRPEPLLVADAIGVSRATYRKIWQNLFWAFVYNLVGIPLAAGAMLSPVVAGAAMAASSVSVVSSSLWLKRWRPQG